MRNFTNDLLSASRPDIKMPFKASEFSWSILRYKLFNRCRRAYFIRYYLAQGGWDEYAHPLARSAYYEKYMLTLDQWMSQAFQKSVISAIRKAIIQQQEKQRRKDFAIHMLRGLSKSVSMLQSSLKNEEYLDDPKKPSVQEYVLEPKVYPDLNDLIAKAVKTLSNAYGALLKADFLQDLLNLDFMDFRLDDQFLYFCRKNFPVWFQPGIIYLQQDMISMLNFNAVSPGVSLLTHSYPEWALKSSLFDLYCREKWEHYRISTMAFNFSDSAVSIGSTPAPVLNLEEIIDNSSREMLELVATDGTVSLECFPQTTNTDHCKNCQFRYTCKGICDEMNTSSSFFPEKA